MKRFYFLAALFCLLAMASPMNAQLVIRNSGHAEIGINPSGDSNDGDTITALKIFGPNGEHAAGARITFGDIPATGHNVMIGEHGNGNSNILWLHGKQGMYITKDNGTLPDNVVAFYDPTQSTGFNFNSDVITQGVFIQSDERLKADIEPMGDVLSSLESIAPVSYYLKSHRDHNRDYSGMDVNETTVRENYYRSLEDGSERFGFLAQNVKEVFPELVHTDMNGYMSVDYIGMIPILVQSINELRAELAAVKGEKKDGDAPMMQAPSQSGQSELEGSLTAAKLYQNAPNPWSSETVIRYTLPQSVVTADIYIYDMQGAQLKRIAALGRGESQVTLTAHDLKAGMYLYALVADGALVDSKQMILTK